MTVSIINPIEVKYPPERVPFSGYNTVDDGDKGTLFNITAFETTRQEYIAYFTDIATEQVVDLLLELTVERDAITGPSGVRSDTRAYNAGALPGIDQALRELSIHATDRIRLQVNNQTGGTVNNHRTWGTLTFDVPSIIDQLARGIEVGRQTQLIERFNLEDRVHFGNAPEHPIGSEVDLENVQRELVDDDYNTADVVPPDGSFRNVFSVSTLGPDYMVALSRLALTPKPSATTAGEFKVRIRRDDQTVTTPEMYALPGITTEVPVWIPANDQFQIDLQGDGGTSVQTRIRRTHFRKTTVDWARWFPADQVADNTDLSVEQAQNLKDFIRAGVAPQPPEQ